MKERCVFDLSTLQSLLSHFGSDLNDELFNSVADTTVLCPSFSPEPKNSFSQLSGDSCWISQLSAFLGIACWLLTVERFPGNSLLTRKLPFPMLNFLAESGLCTIDWCSYSSSWLPCLSVRHLWKAALPLKLLMVWTEVFAVTFSKWIRASQGCALRNSMVYYPNFSTASPAKERVTHFSAARKVGCWWFST